MSYYFTSSDLLNSIKRNNSFPSSQNAYSDAELLSMANEEMRIKLVPLVKSKNQGYYLVRENTALVSNQLAYDIPYRAIGNTVREVAYSSDVSDINDVSEMVEIKIDDLTSMTTNISNGFYIQNEQVILYMDDGEVPDGYLVFFYDLRPNLLVDSDRVGVITAINTSTGVVTFSSIPAHFTTSLEYDFIKTKSPHKVISYDKTATSVNLGANTITFATTDIPSTLVVGDRIAQAGETDIICAPSDLHPILADYTVAKINRAMSEFDSLEATNGNIRDCINSAEQLIGNRVTGSPVKAKNRNSFLRGSRTKRRAIISE